MREKRYDEDMKGTQGKEEERNTVEAKGNKRDKRKSGRV